jgi:hypothetical protein
VFAWDTHAYVAARRSNESVGVHFLNGANDFGANITGDNSIRGRAAWRGQSKRPGRCIVLREFCVGYPFKNGVKIFDFGASLGVETIEIVLNALQRHSLDRVANE